MSKTWIEATVNDMGFDAHLTIHYLGDIDFSIRHKFGSFLAQQQLDRYVTAVKPIAIKMFGPEKNIPVVTVDVMDDLQTLKSTLEKIYPQQSEYSWNPHITLGKVGWDLVVIPTIIKIKGIHLRSKP